MTESLAICVSARDHVRGAPTAQVTLVKYADFGCPLSARAYPVVKELLLHYRTTLRVVFRHNPRVELHPGAWLAALAAEAAGVQGKFWAMHDLLFERHAPINEGRLEGYAALLELDVPRFRSDLRSPALASRVRDDEVGGQRSGVIGTPTFFVNNRQFQDKPDLETLFMAVGFSLLSCSSRKRRTSSTKRL